MMSNTRFPSTVRNPVLWSVALLAWFWPDAAMAHVESGEAGGFLSGVSHPVSGLDHVLAMVAVGLWGVQLGHPAVWLLPIVFPMMMALGGMLGLMGVPVPGVEIGIAALLLTPSVAHAHLVTSGLGPFYDGAMHLALSPDDLLGLFAAALLAGLCGPQAGRWTLAVLPVAWLVGAMVGLTVSGVPALAGLSILSFVALGVLVALDAKLPAAAVATLGSLFGLLHGVLNGTALAQANAGMVNVLGIVATVAILLLFVSAAVVSLRPAWTRIAVRVAGSWVVAIGMLMFGWMYRGTF